MSSEFKPFRSWEIKEGHQVRCIPHGVVCCSCEKLTDDDDTCRFMTYNSRRLVIHSWLLRDQICPNFTIVMGLRCKSSLRYESLNVLLTFEFRGW